MTATLKSNLGLFADSLERTVVEVALKGGKQAVAGIKQGMQAPKSGRRYGAHQASAPGESPAVKSGDLTGSLDAVQVSDSEVAVFTDDPKAARLEFGDGRTAARPFMTGAAYELEQELPPAAVNAINELAAKLAIK